MNKKYLDKLLQKGYVLMDNKNDSMLSNEECMTIFKELNISFNSLGYALSFKDVSLIKNMDIESIKEFYIVTYHVLSKAKGNHVRHTIFYRNFPKMKDITLEEYEIRALLHYLTASEDDMGFMNEDISSREEIEVHSKDKQILRIINSQEADKLIVKIARMMFEGSVVIPLCEHEFLKNVFNDYKGQIVPQEIPFKENIGLYVSLIVNGKNIKEVLTYSSLKFIKTMTDFLRVYACLSSSSPTLKEKVKFISLNRSLRVMFLSILDKIAYNCDAFDELNKHEFLFKKAFEKLHVGDYAKEYSYIFDVVKNFRNGDYKTFNGRLNELLNNQEEYLILLSSKPGEYARRMDFLLRDNRFDNDLVFYYFYEIKEHISSNVLIQLWEFFVNRKKEDERVFCIKKQYNNLYYACEDKREEIDEVTKDKVIKAIEKVLVTRFKSRTKIENVYLDEKMKNYMIPTSMRNRSASNHILTLCTRIKLDQEDGNYIRLFTHWKNNNSRTDIDLSIELFNENFTKSRSLAWHNMGGGKKFNSYHSGDIVTAPKGASEFVDFDYVKASQYYRYVLVVNSVFTGQEFAEISDCFSGIMFMNSLGKKGKVFNPEFVKYKFDLTQVGSSQNVIFMVDLKTMELIYIDSPLPCCDYSSIASVNPSILKVLKDALKRRMSLYELIGLHKEHLTFVDDKKKALFIISNEDDANLKPTDVEEISLNWL